MSVKTIRVSAVVSVLGLSGLWIYLSVIPAFEQDVYSGWALFSLSIELACWVAYLAGTWGIFRKAGYEPSLACIPIMNVYTLWQIAMMNRASFWLMFVPFVNLAPWILMHQKLAEQFGKKNPTLYGLGMATFPFAYYPVLGLASSEVFRNQRKDDTATRDATMKPMDS